MSENQMIPSPPGGSLRFGEQQYPPSAPTTPPANPIRLVHSFFRGHYLVLWIMLIVLTPLGAWLGNKCGHTLYRSVGLIRVDPVGQAILFHNEENGAITMYDQFLDTEAARIRSSRVITDAMQDPAWTQVPGTLPANLSDQIAEELLVNHQSELLSVSVWDPNSKVAVTAVGAIIRAYLRIYNEENNTKEQGRMMALNDRRVNEQAEVDNYSKEILETAASNAYGTDDLTSAYNDKREELSALEKELSDYTQQISMATQYGSVPLTEDDIISRSNTHYSDDLKQRDQLLQQLKLLALKYGDKHDTVVQAKGELSVVNEDIAQIKTDYERTHGLLQPKTAATRPAGAAAARLDPAAMLRTMVERCKAELADIGRANLRLEDLKAKKAQAEAALLDTTNRIDSLQTEADAAQNARLEIVSEGEPAVRSSDIQDTHLALAALGGGLGVSISVLVVSLLSLRDRRFHGPEDTQYSQVRVPMLGMLPTLGADMTDTEQAAMAAHFVHGIRAALQIKGTGGTGGRVIAITSPSAHNGKTSLSLALGVSFAGAHSKTLLIDCDFVGRALTNRVNAVARPRLGRVLRHQGLVDDADLKSGLDMAGLKGKRLGEALLDMGVLTPEKLESALAAQKNQTFGVLEAIDGEDLIECVAPTDIPGLSILPLGQANAEHIGSLSPAMVRQVLETCRERYDVIIVDTGPILGSLEAAMVATQADDVVVVLSSGENRAAAERSLRYLDSVGAKVAGFVFNRATTRDFVRSDSAQRVSSSANRWSHAKSWTQSRQLARFGPVAQAVARSVGDIGSSGSNGNGKPANGHAANGERANGERANGERPNGDSHAS